MKEAPDRKFIKTVPCLRKLSPCAKVSIMLLFFFSFSDQKLSDCGNKLQRNGSFPQLLCENVGVSTGESLSCSALPALLRSHANANIPHSHLLEMRSQTVTRSGLTSPPPHDPEAQTLTNDA